MQRTTVIQPQTTSTAASWGPIPDWRQQAAYEEQEGRLRSSNRGWGGRQNGMFCQWSSGRQVHFELNMSCSGGADSDLQTGRRSRKWRSIRWVVLGPTMHSDSVRKEQRHPSPPSWTGLLPAPPSTFKKGFLCQRTSCTCRQKRLKVESTPNHGATRCNAQSDSRVWSWPFFSYLFTWFQSVSEDRKWVISRGPDI